MVKRYILCAYVVVSDGLTEVFFLLFLLVNAVACKYIRNIGKMADAPICGQIKVDFVGYVLDFVSDLLIMAIIPTKIRICSSTDRVENGKTNVFNNNTNRWLVSKCEIEDISKENAVLYENTL